MAKKKKHWSAILDVVVKRRCGEGDEACEWAKGMASFSDAWDNCQHGYWMEFLCGLISRHLGDPVYMWKNGWREQMATEESRDYWMAYPPGNDPEGFNRKNWSDDIRKLWPKPPRIPKKLLKEAGLA